MAFKKVTMEGVNQASSAGSYTSGANPFTEGFKMLNLNMPGETFTLRILPPVNDSKVFSDESNAFAFCMPTHGSVGNNGKETCICPKKHSPKHMVTCPFCKEFSENAGTQRSKMNFYYYMNVVLRSKHTHKKTGEIPRQKEGGKFIVYTIKVPKKTVFDVIADYYKDEERSIADLCDLKEGCSITIKVEEISTGNAKYPKYTVTVKEGSKGDITQYVDENDVKDLRLIGRYIPTSAAMRNIAAGMSVAESMMAMGKIDITTGEQIGGKKEIAPAVEKSQDIELLDNLDDFGDDVQVETAPPAKAEKKPSKPADDDLILDDDDLS